MKIISKYKDFYDYMWIDSDPDITYVRKEKLCFSLPNINTSYEKHYGEGLDISHCNFAGYVRVIGYTFGIYPYVYTTPALQICKGYCKHDVYLFDKNDLEALKIIGNNKKQRKEFFQAIYDKAFSDDNCVPDMNLEYALEKRPYEDIMRYCWKEENQEFFFNIKSPVFITYAIELFGKTYDYLRYVEFDNKNIDKIQLCDKLPLLVDSYGHYMPKIITNICFNKLNYQIHKFWFDEMNNVYSDIENFLMTSRLDPEPKINNDGKIIAHGFDLKTSFRKM